MWPQTQGGDSIENNWLEFRFEKRIDIPFWFRNMSELPILERFPSIGNLKPKLKWFFKPKLKPKFCLLNWSPGLQRDKQCDLRIWLWWQLHSREWSPDITILSWELHGSYCMHLLHLAAPQHEHQLHLHLYGYRGFDAHWMLRFCKNLWRKFYTIWLCWHGVRQSTIGDYGVSTKQHLAQV